MDGTEQLLQLAHLLRMGAETAHDLTTIRPKDAGAIGDTALLMVKAAEALEIIAKGTKDGQAPAGTA